MLQTLLIVDDEPNIVEGLASQFESRYDGNVVVLKSFSGRHALSILQNTKVDVVLSDIRMPDMDGLTLQREAEQLWPHIHFVFLSGFDDFQYIHQASKSPLYRGYLLKMEGDEVVLAKIDQEIAQCAEETRLEMERGEMLRRYTRMQTFLQRAMIEYFLRGNCSWQELSEQLGDVQLSLDLTRPISMVIGKHIAAQTLGNLQNLLMMDSILAVQFPKLTNECFMPEGNTVVVLLQSNAEDVPLTSQYLYAVFEALQQQLSDTVDCPVSFIVGKAVMVEQLPEQYSLLNRIYRMVDHGTGRLLIADENTYTDFLSDEKNTVQNQFQFFTLLQTLDQLIRTGSADDIQSLMQATFFQAKNPPVLDNEQQMLLFVMLLDARRDIFVELSEKQPGQDKACFELLNKFLYGSAASQQEILQQFTALCIDTCRQRERNGSHNAKVIIRQIDRYIEENVEKYDLSLATLARISGFNPSYLSRFYRLNTGKKLSEQIEKVRLEHAKKLVAQGELVKKVAERTGFASSSAFILFFKRNTGVTPKQYFEDLGKEKQSHDE